MSLKPTRGLALTQGFLALALVFALIVFSEHGFKASVAGMKLFFDVVFPSLLPFFILSELLLALGMVHFLGVFFEPIMRPLFNVPGVGSFVLSMGLAAGYPMDAVLTAKFRKQNLCTRIEGERMLAFTNTADPLFLFGAVAVGMFGAPEIGIVLAVAHYASAICVGLIFRFYGVRQETRDIPQEAFSRHTDGLMRRAITALMTAREEDARPLGKVLNDAISESVATLFMIMSFMVLFSVLIAVLAAVGFIHWLALPLGALLSLLGLSPHLVSALVKGLMEIDLGSAAAAAANAPLSQRLILTSAIIAWSGLSVHGQVASVLTDSDIRMRPYFAARLLHAVLAAIFTGGVFALHIVSIPAIRLTGVLTLPGFTDSLRYGVTAALLCLAALIGLGLLSCLVHAIRPSRLRL